MKINTPKKRVLFVCTHNAARSQMAEAFLNKIYGDRYTAFSAGSDPAQIEPIVVEVMNEVGIDVSNYHSKNLFNILQEEERCFAKYYTRLIFQIGRKKS